MEWFENIPRIKSNKVYFFAYLLEKYAEYKNTIAPEILKKWEETGQIDYINAMYEQYHTERLENAFEDIDRKMNELSKI